MSDETPSPYEQAQRELDAWHATHPEATLYDLEKAVEQQIEGLRTTLLGNPDRRQVRGRAAGVPALWHDHGATDHEAKAGGDEGR